MTMLAPQPRYHQLAQTLINEMESGRYPVGDLPPTEFKLRRKPLKQLVQLDLWSFCTECGSTEPSSTGRRRKLPRNEPRSTAEKDVPAGTMAVVRSPDFLRALRETALATLIHRRRLTPSRGEQAPTPERTVGPAKMIGESLTPKPGIREQYRYSSAVV